MTTRLEVVASGPLTTIQDLGRHGFAHYGVPPSGAADRAALRRANAIVGNAEGAAALEVTLGGLHVGSDGPVGVALAGARCAVAAGDFVVEHETEFLLEPGVTLRVGRPPAGVRTYLGVAGGIDVPPVLGSRSTDLLSGLGPDVVQAGMRLAVGDGPVSEARLLDDVPRWVWPGEAVRLRVVLGPRDDWFTDSARDALTSEAWTVTPESNRVGMHLSGVPLERAVRGELPSEGLVRGAVQVPPSGRPTLLLADHPLTGGYPVIAVVVDADADQAAQVRPGQSIRFVVAQA